MFVRQAAAAVLNLSPRYFGLEPSPLTAVSAGSGSSGSGGSGSGGSGSGGSGSGGSGSGGSGSGGSGSGGSGSGGSGSGGSGSGRLSSLYATAERHENKGPVLRMTSNSARKPSITSITLDNIANICIA